MGNQTWWDIITVKSLYTTHFVHMHSRRVKETEGGGGGGGDAF